MKALVSVIMPCFNAGRWLGKAVDSLLAQSYGRIEIIAINDGSTDDTGDILDAVARRDTRLRVVHAGTNLGIVSALNRGLDVADGSLIARMDADDICKPRRLERQVAFLESGAADICGSWFIEFGQGPRRTTRWPHATDAVEAAMLFQNAICHPTLVAKREVFDRFRYREDFRLAEDYDLLSRAMRDFRIANVAEPLLYYRRHPAQATQASRLRMEAITKNIRRQALASRNIFPDAGQARLHDLIRAPASITDPRDLAGIEAWLLSLLERPWTPGATRVIASQWIRACVRAAPLGAAMREAFRRSPLTKVSQSGFMTGVDLAALSLMKLDYRSRGFSFLRRLGLSA